MALGCCSNCGSPNLVTIELSDDPNEPDLMECEDCGETCDDPTHANADG